ncbi:MAG: hypothetical protein ABSA43_02915 [Candidatus Microgenomates bacterium]|jgi:hypothetical protein
MPAAAASQSSTLPIPEKDLLSWIAPARPFKRRGREFYITVISIAAIAGLVIFLAEGMMPVILIISLIFLFYILNTVEPENLEYKLTDQGIKIAGVRTDWQFTRRFWFTTRLGTELLVVETAIVPGRLELVIKPEMKEEIKKVMLIYIVEEEAPPSTLDRLSSWFARKLPQN